MFIISATLKALDDLTSPAMRRVLLKSLGLTVLLFAALMTAAQLALAHFADLPWDWAETALAWLAGLGLLAAMVFLMGPVTALFAGLFLDDIAEAVERAHYPADPPGRPLPFWPGLWLGLQSALLMLAVLLLTLPLWFVAVGAFVKVLVDGWLLSREFFILAAARHMPVAKARALRKRLAGKVFLAGLPLAGLAHVPLANLFAPLLGTAYFVHVHKLLTGRA